MRHKLKGKQLGMTVEKRRKLLRNQASSLISHDKIVTTEAKAKVLKSYIDRAVTIANRYDKRRAKERLHALINDKAAIQKFVSKTAPKYKDRKGSAVRLAKLGRRRGDNVMKVQVEFV